MRISTVFSIVIGASIVIMFTSASELSIAYAVACSTILFFLYISKYFSEKQEKMYLIMAVVLWMFFLFRSIVLALHPEFFKYFLLGSLTVEMHRHALYEIAILNVCVFSGLTLASIVSFGATHRIVDESNDYLKRVHGIVIPIIIILFIMDVFLTVVFGVGHADSTSNLNFLGFILPFGVVLPFSLVYVTMWKRFKPFFFYKYLIYALLILVPLLTIFKGSKSGMIELVFIFLLSVVALKGNLRLNWKYLLGLGMLVTMSMLAFPLAMAIRRVADPSGLSLSALSEQLLRASDTNQSAVWYVIDLFTSRMNGLDGVIGVHLFHPEKILQIFSVSNAFERAMAGLLPGVSGGGGVGFGKAVSMYYLGFTEEMSHAGGLGAYGALRLMAGNDYFQLVVACILYGLLWGVMGRAVLSNRLSSTLQQVGFIYWGLLLAFWTSGGNFDRALRDGIISLSHLILVLMISTLIVSVLMSERRKPVRVFDPLEGIYHLVRTRWWKP